MKKLLLILLLFSLGIITLQAQTHKVTVTVYNPVPSQCSGSHLRTADGSMIDIEALERGEIRWCAVSRDMLTRNGGDFKFGDRLEVISADETISGIYEIHDTMNPRFSRHVDILMPERINTGKWTDVKIIKHLKTL